MNELDPPKTWEYIFSDIIGEFHSFYKEKAINDKDYEKKHTHKHTHTKDDDSSDYKIHYIAYELEINVYSEHFYDFSF